jgi:hypothetical protein
MRNVGADNTTNKTGFTVSEFYTAKDFPVIVKKMDKHHQSHKPSPLLNLFKVKVESAVGVSQGYSIELNDMHGRERSESIYDRGGSKISGAEYIYKTDNPLASQQRLQNSVLLLSPDGTIKDGRIGEDIELFTDMREQYTENIGGSVHASAGAFMAWIFPVPYFFPGIGPNIDTRAFRSASTVKVVNKFAVLQKVKKIQDGSAVSTENVAWDSETGEVLLTRTYNEFNDPIYSLTYPAHWAYGGMGQAYKNIGLEIKGISTTSSRALVNLPPDLLVAGDEVINVATGAKGWISIPGNGSGIFLINAAGESQVLNNATLKVTRSGKRNQAKVPIGNITSLRNPVKGGRLDITAFTQVLEVGATTFKETWQAPLNQVACGCPPDYVMSSDGLNCNKYDTIPAATPELIQVCAATHESYGDRFTHIYDPGYNINGTGTGDTIALTNAFWRNTAGPGGIQGPLNRTGVWACPPRVIPNNTWIGFRTAVNVPTTKRYYIGMGGDNQTRFKVDGQVVVEQNATIIGNYFGFGLTDAFTIWHVYPVDLTAGVHYIEMEGLNFGSAASFGAEIYNNTQAELMSATGYTDIDTVFSSMNARGQFFQVGDVLDVCPDGYTPTPDGTGCVILVDQVPVQTPAPFINPYLSGILGNWRVWQQYGYHDVRRQVPENGITNIRRSGIFNGFTPFWTFSGGTFKPVNATDFPNWVMATESTKFNDKGLGIENKDGLNRYSSALFGYLGSVPVAIASNARNTDIGYDGFEDYQYSLSCGQQQLNECNVEKHFDFRKLLLQDIRPVREAAHTGNYSLKLSAPAVVKRMVTDHQTGNLLQYDANGQAAITAFTDIKPFSPARNGRYITSVWIRANGINMNTANIVEVLSGNNVIASSIAAGPQIEGWRKVEVTFVVPNDAGEISIRLNPKGGNSYFDDIRIHPFDSQLKSFVYNSNNMFLMAELDENNYASFYEYDDEGSLVRMKKETEKGIVTLKESRRVYKTQ